MQRKPYQRALSHAKTNQAASKVVIRLEEDCNCELFQTSIHLKPYVPYQKYTVRRRKKYFQCYEPELNQVTNLKKIDFVVSSDESEAEVIRVPQKERQKQRQKTAPAQSNHAPANQPRKLVGTFKQLKPPPPPAVRASSAKPPPEKVPVEEKRVRKRYETPCTRHPQPVKPPARAPEKVQLKKPVYVKPVERKIRPIPAQRKQESPRVRLRGTAKTREGSSEGSSCGCCECLLSD